MKSVIGGIVLGVVGLSLFVACSDEGSGTNPGKDAGGTQDATSPGADTGASTPGDAGADTGTTTTDGGDAGTGIALTPSVLTIASGRHARLFNVIYTANGIYAVGQVGTQADPDDMATLVVKLTATGALDTSFNGTGFIVHNFKVGKGGESARGLVMQSSGKLLVSAAVEHGVAGDGGTFDATRDIVVARLNANGTLDGTFGTAGVKTLVMTNGENVSTWGLTKVSGGNEDLLVVGTRKQQSDAATPINETTVTKLSGTDGAVITAFGGNNDGTFSLALSTNQSPKTAEVQADGKIVVAGYTNFNGNKPVVVRLNADGTRDNTFGVNGVFFPESGVPGIDPSGSAEAYAAQLQGTKIVTTGYGREVSTQPAVGWISLRLNANGTIDNTYGTNGHVFFGINGQAANSRGMTVLADKRVVLVGGGSPQKANPDAGANSQFAGIAVLSENGANDPKISPQGPRLFDLGGPAVGRAAHVFWAAAESPDHTKLIVVGIKGSVTANADAGVAGGVDEAATLVVPLD